MRDESMSHPNMNFWVEKVSSPFANFDVEITCRCSVSGGSWKMSWRACSSLFSVGRCCGRWASTMKSLMCISVYERGVFLVDGRLWLWDDRLCFVVGLVVVLSLARDVWHWVDAVDCL